MAEMGTDPGQASGGDPAQTGTPPAGSDENLKREIASLREENRRLNAQSLGSAHNLPAEVIDLIAGLPKDQQEAKAKAVAEALKPQQPTQPQPTGQPTAAATGQPQQQQAPVAVPPTAAQGVPNQAPQPIPPGQAPEGTPRDVAALMRIGSSPEGSEGTAPTGSGEDLLSRIQGAKSWEEVEQIQQAGIAAQRQGAQE